MAGPKRVKRKEGENLTDANIQKVINLLEQQKPITKKEACEILNISYNTTRLGKIIEEYKHEKILDEKRRAANRGKPATDHEIQTTIEYYLAGDSVSDIAKSLYRSASFVRDIVEKVGVPQRRAGQTYFDFDPLPVQCVSDRFEAGEIVWSARHQAAAEVVKEQGPSSDGESLVYQIYVFEPVVEPEEKYFSSWGKPGFYASQCAYDLGKLSHLEKYKVNVKRTLKVA